MTLNPCAKILVAALCVVTGAGAATYYVDTAGTDSPANGTVSNPWKTLAYACGQVDANQGHTIHLGMGTFTETSEAVLKTGVNIQGEGPDKSILVSARAGNLITLHSTTLIAGNQTLSDFAIDGDNGQLATGISVRNVDGVVISNVSISYTKDNAIHALGGDASPMKIEIANSTFLNAAADYADWSNGVIFGGNLQNALIHGNTINSDRGYGIKITEGIAQKAILVFNNSVNVTGNNATWGFNFPVEIWNMTNACRVSNNTTNGVFSLVKGLKGDSAKSLLVQNNRVICAAGREFWGIELGDIGDVDISDNYFENCDHGVMVDFAITNVRIFRNVFFNMFNGGGVSSALYAYESGAAVNTLFANNVVDGSAFAGVVLHGESGGSFSDTRIQNNVFTDVGTVLMFLVKTGATAQATTLSYNIRQNCPQDVGYWDGNQSNVSATVAENNLSGDPGLIASGNKPSPYYVPDNASSLVVDAGTDVGLPYADAAPDIGAFEYIVTPVVRQLSRGYAPALQHTRRIAGQALSVAGRQLPESPRATSIAIYRAGMRAPVLSGMR